MPGYYFMSLWMPHFSSWFRQSYCRIYIQGDRKRCKILKNRPSLQNLTLKNLRIILRWFFEKILVPRVSLTTETRKIELYAPDVIGMNLFKAYNIVHIYKKK